MRPISEDELIYLIKRARSDLPLGRYGVRRVLHETLSPDGGDIAFLAYTLERVLEILSSPKILGEEATPGWVARQLSDLLTFQEAASHLKMKEHELRGEVRFLNESGDIQPVRGFRTMHQAERNNPSTRRWEREDLGRLL